MIVIIDYGIGNLASIVNAFQKFKITTVISDNPSVIRKAEKLILPGVGAAGEGMRNIKDRKLDRVLVETITTGKPFLGICLGMQLLFEKSEEGDVGCLGILEGTVKKFKKERKIPQIGWNEVQYQKHRLNTKRLFARISNNSYFYFVNSYYCDPADRSIIAGETEYGERFASIIVKDNIIATQFHPEKSGKIGMQFLQNWSSR